MTNLKNPKIRGRQRAGNPISFTVPENATVSDVRVQGEKQEGVDAILAERGTRYGKFEDHARVTQSLKDVIAGRLAERHIVLANDQREALDMIAHKLGRIVNGDPDYADSWVDIAGYAKLVADRLEGRAR